MKSQADIIMNHIEHAKSEDIQNILVTYSDIMKRYMDFTVRWGLEDAEAYDLFATMYARELRRKEISMGVSYKIWSKEVMREFENDFTNTYIVPLMK